MSTVTIGGDTFPVIGDVAGLATYAAGHALYHATYAAAALADADTPKRALITATRAFAAQAWDGTASGSVAWPRTGVSAKPPSGTAVTDGVTPTEIMDGYYELCLSLIAKPAGAVATSTGANIQSVGAGPAQVTFFSPTVGGRFPDRVMELVGWAMGGASSSTIVPGGAYVAGMDGCSQFDTCDTYGRTGPG